MLLVPKNDPVLQDLNSHYLKVESFLEHFRGQLGSGAVYFRSANAEGIVFFDSEEILNCAFQEGELKQEGDTALKTLLAQATKRSFTVDVFSLSPDSVYLWANTPHAGILYKDLASDFTDFMGLVNKLTEELLTGYVAVKLADGNESALVLFDGGTVVDGTYDFKDSKELFDDYELLEALSERAREVGGSYNVYKVTFEGEDAKAQEALSGTPPEVVRAVQALLTHLEDVIRIKSLGDRPGAFKPVINRKFLQKADTFPFLDPFAGEMTYEDRKLVCYGEIEPELLVRGVLESALELGNEHGAERLLAERLAEWSRRFWRVIHTMDLPIRT